MRRFCLSFGSEGICVSRVGLREFDLVMAFIYLFIFLSCLECFGVFVRCFYLREG